MGAERTPTFTRARGSCEGDSSGDGSDGRGQAEGQGGAAGVGEGRIGGAFIRYATRG